MTDTVTLPTPPTDTGDVTSRGSYAFRLVEAWLYQAAMHTLMEGFSHRLPEPWSVARVTIPSLHLNEKLPPWLGAVLDEPATAGVSAEQSDLLRRMLVIESMAEENFHFRKDGDKEYVERAHAESADFDEDLRRRITALGRRLGLVASTRPEHDRYDMTLVLGGGNRSPLLRSRYAAYLEGHRIDLGKLSFLGSPRFMMAADPDKGVPAEASVVADYAPGATDEFDLMIAGARRAFGFDAHDTVFLCGCRSAEQTCPAWPYEYRRPADAKPTPPQFTHERLSELTDVSGAVRGTVLSAHTGRPPIRPETSDTFGLWARHLRPQEGQRVLVVTTQVFVPFQNFDAVRLIYLPYGAVVETVGFGRDLGEEWVDRPQAAEFLLQETLSAIRSARRLLVDATATLMKRNAAG